MRELPSISYPQDNYIAEACRVQILVSCEAWAMRRSDQCEWQIAHECVHLLDPVKRGRANVLEEGLAVWFQDELRFHSRPIQQYIRENERHPEHYQMAKDLVLQCQPWIVPTVKKIRRSGIRISAITEREINQHLPNADIGVVRSLCERFENKP